MTLFSKTVQVMKHLKGDSFESMARAFKISPAFARHICSSDSVPVSERLVKLMADRYDVPLKTFQILAAQRNKIGRKYVKRYRSKKSPSKKS